MLSTVPQSLAIRTQNDVDAKRSGVVKLAAFAFTTGFDVSPVEPSYH